MKQVNWVKQVKGRFRKEDENIEEFGDHLFCRLKSTVKHLSGYEALGKWFISGTIHTGMRMTLAGK